MSQIQHFAVIFSRVTEFSQISYAFLLHVIAHVTCSGCHALLYATRNLAMFDVLKLPLSLTQSNDDHSLVAAVNKVKSRIITCKCQNVVIHIVASQIFAN